MSVVYRLTQDNRKESKTKGKWYARALHTGVIDIEGLANIMQANCTLKKSDILAVIANRKRASFLLQGMSVKEATKYDVKKPKKARGGATSETAHA